jgi:hypothetical protein
MSFLYDKPMIVRLIPIVFTVIGVVMFYSGFVTANDISYSVIMVALGASCIAASTLILIRHRLAWGVTMALIALFAVYFVISFAETNDMIWILLFLVDATVAFSWYIGFTRNWFEQERPIV